MAATREQVLAALLAVLQTTAAYKTVSRRNRAPVKPRKHNFRLGITQPTVVFYYIWRTVYTD